jgi:hypothetical protein
MHHAMRNAQRHAIGQPLVQQLPTQHFDDMRLVFIVISVAETHAPSCDKHSPRQMALATCKLREVPWVSGMTHSNALKDDLHLQSGLCSLSMQLCAAVLMLLLRTFFEVQAALSVLPEQPCRTLVTPRRKQRNAARTGDLIGRQLWGCRQQRHRRKMPGGPSTAKCKAKAQTPSTKPGNPSFAGTNVRLTSNRGRSRLRGLPLLHEVPELGDLQANAT